MLDACNLETKRDYMVRGKRAMNSACYSASVFDTRTRGKSLLHLVNVSASKKICAPRKCRPSCLVPLCAVDVRHQAKFMAKEPMTRMYGMQHTSFPVSLCDRYKWHSPDSLLL